MFNIRVPPTAFGLLALGAAFAVDAGIADSVQPISDRHMTVSTDRNDAHERSYRRTVHRYRTPQVQLVDVADTVVDFSVALRAHDTVMVSFIFTTCGGVCPVITANMARAIPELNRLGIDYGIYLVSLDPEHDTPARLHEYGEKFRLDDQIRLLTGDSAAVFEVLRAFNAVYLGGRKMNHQPVTLIRAGGGAAWIRLDGMIDGPSLAREVALARQGAGDGIASVAR